MGGGVLYTVCVIVVWCNNRRTVEVFSVHCVPRLYNEHLRLRGSLEMAVISIGGWCEVAASLGVSRVEWVGWWVSELLRGLLRFSPGELLLLEAGSWGTGTFWEPRGRGTFAVGSHYQKAGEDTAGWLYLSVWCSELQSVWTSDSAIVTFSYNM
jgi:hypothetical protein